MKIYTKTGDDGTTGVIGGRIEKDHCRVEAYGTIDELNSWLGLAITHLADSRYADIVDILNEIQRQLFDCCSDLAAVDMNQWQYRIHADAVEFLEDAIDHFEQEIPGVREFIIPGGSQPSSILHVCRTVARRAERRTITVIRQEAVANADVLRFLNRLSDLLFILARTCNVRDEINDVVYQHKN